MRSICVYCGSNSGSKPAYTERAMALGDRIARDGLRLVYGGGNVGLMGTVANAVLEAGGQVTGVIPQQLADWEVAHRGLTELEMVGTLTSASGNLFALIEDSDGGIHRVRNGNYMGTNYGRIIGISETRVELLEIVPNGSGGWVERPRSLSLEEEG